MDFQKKANEKWKDKINEMDLKYDKTLYSGMLMFISILIIGIFIQISIQHNFDNVIIFISLISIFLSIYILVVFLKNIKNKKSGDIYFIIMIFICDAVILFYSITYYLEVSIYIRLFYYLISNNICFMISKSEISRLYFIYWILLKIICFGTFIYTYIKSVKTPILIFLDLYIIVFSIGIIFLIRYLKCNLQGNIIIMNEENIGLANRLTNMINSIKSPIISVNLKEKDIIFNISFINFIKENFHREEYASKYLFDEITEENYSSNYIDNLVMSLEDKDKNFLNNLGDDIINQNGSKMYSTLKVRILILNNIFRSFLKDQNEIHQNLNFLELLAQKQVLIINEYIQKGEYIIGSSLNEKRINVCCSKNFYHDNEEVLSIFLTDITAIRHNQYEMAENKYKKIYLPKIAKDFENPLVSLTSGLTNLFIQFDLLKENYNIDLFNEIKFIESYSNYMSILIQNLNDSSKNIKEDYQINYQLVILKY